MTEATVNNRKSKRTLIYMALFFCAPFLLSWYLFNFTNVLHDGGSASHGDLLIPPRPLPNISLQDPANVITNAELKGKWTLLFITSNYCDEVCEENLYRMRQIRLAMGKNTSRVQRAMVISNSMLSEEIADKLRGYPGQLLHLNDEPTDNFINHFKISGSDDPFTANRLYLIDPLGNLMMSYTPDADPMGIIKDLKRMLRISRIG
jgi:cytochrome oxidase Cu insertion factor (SCO1/SenC/PrrC family)